jgi:F420-dependent oxidoreductase-like protein
MRFALMIEAQQGLSYQEILGLAQRAEAGGFEAFFRSDHYSSFPGPTGMSTTDAWAVLAGLARETATIRLGALVSPITFRYPGNLAKVVTTVDEMSGGRIEVGVGAGWNELEHRQHGFPFPPIQVRADMLEEELAILHGLWTEPDGWSFKGRHYAIEDAHFEPKPVDVPGRPRARNGAVRPRIILGGEGKPRSMRLAARFADEFNVTSSSPDRVADRYARLDAECAAIGRDPATISRSAMVGVLIGATEADVTRRVAAMMKAVGENSGTEAWLAARRERWIMGTPDDARAMVRRFAEAGAERIMLQDFLPWDLEMVEFMSQELVGKV